MVEIEMKDFRGKNKKLTKVLLTKRSSRKKKRRLIVNRTVPRETVTDKKTIVATRQHLRVKKRINLENYSKELEEIVDSIYRNEITSKEELLNRLEILFGSRVPIFCVDNRVKAFSDYCFLNSNIRLTNTADKYLTVLKKIIEIDDGLREYLDFNANHIIGKMVIEGNKSKRFTIEDRYDFKRVIKIWNNYLNLKRVTSRSVLIAILHKKRVKEQLQENNFYLMALLKEIFPHNTSEFIPPEINLDEEIFKIERTHFESKIRKKMSEGYSLEKIISIENNSLHRRGLRRNSFLSYLVKRKHNFNCQICLSLKKIKRKAKNSGLDRPRYFVQAHHILPLAQGGDDHSSNIIVLCNYHHQAVHQNKIKLTVIGKRPYILVRINNKTLKIETN